MNTVRSKDGTAIAYEVMGSGPPLVLVDGALCSSAFGPTPKLAGLLAQRFTVYMYDRRGRGNSGDTAPYAKEREVEDIEALIGVAGAPVHLLGFSSGAALAMEAVASGLAVEKLALYEPPYMVLPEDAAYHAQAHHENRLRQLIALDQRSDAVRYFMRRMVKIPAPIVFLMRLLPMWSKLKAVAHTLPYDAAIMGDFSLPQRRLNVVAVPTLVLGGDKSDNRLREAAQAVAKQLINARLKLLKNQTHNVKIDVLSPVVQEFFAAA